MLNGSQWIPKFSQNTEGLLTSPRALVFTRHSRSRLIKSQLSLYKLKGTLFNSLSHCSEILILSLHIFCVLQISDSQSLSLLSRIITKATPFYCHSLILSRRPINPPLLRISFIFVPDLQWLGFSAVCMLSTKSVHLQQGFVNNS